MTLRECWERCVLNYRERGLRSCASGLRVHQLKYDGSGWPTRDYPTVEEE